MKIAFAVMSCNRLHYLKNCIKSINQFVDMSNIEIIVVDNNTIEHGALEYFDEISKIAHVKIFHDRVPNELYRAMNYAIEYCINTDIGIVNFLQDDYQYLYKLDSMIPTVIQCFSSHKHVGQVNTGMAWKRKRISSWPVVRVNNTNLSLLTDKRLVDNGFTRVSIYKKIGLYPDSVISYDQNSDKTFGFGKDRYKKMVNGEIWFGQKSKKLGYIRAMSLMPNQAMIYDCAYVRNMSRFGRYFPPPSDFYLKPFSPEKIDVVKRCHDKKRFCFIESMVEADGWIPTTLDKHNRENIVEKIDG